MTQQKSFSKITLLNGDSCEIFEPKAIHLMRANFQMLLLDKENKVGIVAYIIQQIISVNGKQPTLEYIFDLCIDDYSSINNVVDVSMKKINL